MSNRGGKSNRERERGVGKSARITCAAKKGKCDLRALYAEQWKSLTNAKTKFPNCLDCSMGKKGEEKGEGLKELDWVM